MFDSDAAFRRTLTQNLTPLRAESDAVAHRVERAFATFHTTPLSADGLGTHLLLEDFKLIHRALDVKKVQAEVRHAELENTRLASRVLKGEDEDPDIEKKIVIEGGMAAVLPGD